MSAPQHTLEQSLAAVKQNRELWRQHCKKLTDEVTGLRNNQRTLIDLLADTMKRLREAEATIERERTMRAKEEAEKSEALLHRILERTSSRSWASPAAALLSETHPWLARACEAAPQEARACEALPTEARACEARACEAAPQEARACEAQLCGTLPQEARPLEPASTEVPPAGAGAAAAAAAGAPSYDDDLYA